MLDILADIKAHLKYLKENNVNGLKINEVENHQLVHIEKIEEDGHVESIRDLQSLRDKNEKLLKELREKLGNCTRCKLYKTRKHIVFGEGNPTPEIVFVGEGPGFDEDKQGVPFVGRAGQLLNRIIAAMGLKREDVYICNVVKCRPPNNRDPEPDEIKVCSPFLLKQLEILDPKVICTLGRVAAQFLLGRKVPMRILRGRFYDFKGICLRATYHPAALLRNPALKRPVWEDVQEIMRYLGKPIQRS